MLLRWSCRALRRWSSTTLPGGLLLPPSKDCSTHLGSHSLAALSLSKRIIVSKPKISESPPNVINFRPPKAVKLRSEAKWGADVMAQGYCILPSLLFRAQSRLGLRTTHLALILQLAEFWWYDGNLPWPKKKTLADRLGLKEKQVQRLVRDLEQRGYIKRVTRMTSHGQTSNAYDLSGLVKKLRELAPEFAAAAKATRKVERPGVALKNKSA
jgi:hypothetical protein